MTMLTDRWGKMGSVLLSLVLSLCFLGHGFAENADEAFSAAEMALSVAEAVSLISLEEVKARENSDPGEKFWQEARDSVKTTKREVYQDLQKVFSGQAVSQIYEKLLGIEENETKQGTFHLELDQVWGIQIRLEQYLSDLKQKQEEYSKLTGKDLVDPAEIKRLETLVDYLKRTLETYAEAETSVKEKTAAQGENEVNSVIGDAMSADVREDKPKGSLADLKINFDELKFSDEYAYTEEYDEPIFQGTEHFVCYYNKDGFMVRKTGHQVYDWGAEVFEEWRDTPVNGSYAIIASTYTADNYLPNGEVQHVEKYGLSSGMESIDVDKYGNPIEMEQP